MVNKRPAIRHSQTCT